MSINNQLVLMQVVLEAIPRRSAMKFNDAFELMKNGTPVTRPSFRERMYVGFDGIKFTYNMPWFKRYEDGGPLIPFIATEEYWISPEDRAADDWVVTTIKYP